jgi:hypothetical protein
VNALGYFTVSGLAGQLRFGLTDDLALTLLPNTSQVQADLHASEARVDS